MSEYNTVGPVIGSDVRVVREAFDLTQADLADAVGVSKKTAYNWEARGSEALPAAGARKFARWALPRLDMEAAAFDIPLITLQRITDSTGTAGASATEQFMSGMKADAQETADSSSVRPGDQERIRSLFEAGERSWLRTNGRSARELALEHWHLAQAVEQAYAFVDAAIDLGVHPTITRELAALISDAALDAGLLIPLISANGPEEAVELLIGRARKLREKAGRPEDADWIPASVFERPVNPATLPDYSNLTQDEHGLAAYEGEKDIAFDADPED